MKLSEMGVSARSAREGAEDSGTRKCNLVAPLARAAPTIAKAMVGPQVMWCPAKALATAEAVTREYSI